MDFLCKRWQLADHAASAQGEFSIVVELFQDAQEIVLWNRSMQFKRRFLYGTCVYIKTGHLINSTYRVWLRWVCGNWEQWKHILSSWGTIIISVTCDDCVSFAVNLGQLILACCDISADRTDLPSQVREAMLRKRFPLLGLKSSEHSPCSQKGRPKASRGRGEKNSWSRSGRRVDRSSLQTRLAHLYCYV